VYVIKIVIKREELDIKEIFTRTSIRRMTYEWK